MKCLKKLRKILLIILFSSGQISGVSPQEYVDFWRKNYKMHIIYNPTTQGFKCGKDYLKLTRPLREHLANYALWYSEIDGVTAIKNNNQAKGKKDFYIIPPSWIINPYK